MAHLNDIAAAFASATLITPSVTVIDRALVEKASRNTPILPSLRAHTLSALKNPAQFTFSRPFGLVWTLYAATFTVANTADTLIANEEHKKDPHPSASTWKTLAFASTFAINVPLGVWKDIRFAQIFGSTPDSTSPARLIHRISPASTAAFLLRDAVTIFGSFTLAQSVSAAIPDHLASEPAAKIVVSQIAVPVLSQVFATPVHLLGLDLHNRRGRVGCAERMRVVGRDLGGAMVVRCARIVPAFGVGILVNRGLREGFGYQDTQGEVEVI